MQFSVHNESSLADVECLLPQELAFGKPTWSVCGYLPPSGARALRTVLVRGTSPLPAGGHVTYVIQSGPGGGGEGDEPFGQGSHFHGMTLHERDVAVAGICRSVLPREQGRVH
jgi:hypothetical protein